MHNTFSRHLALMLLGAALGGTLTGCGNAVIYGEGTNFSLTTLRVNDDPSTPVRVVSGLDRTVAAISPRRASGGDAVNMAADFHLDHPKAHGFLGVFDDTLKITTEFTSGQAAVADDNVSPSPLAKNIIGHPPAE